MCSILSNTSYLANNNTSVFEYLIKKLDSRIKNLHKTRIAINNIVDMNELKENKVYMQKHFQDIEDEINQAIHSLRALLTQNADVSEHADSCIKKARATELKMISETKANNELKSLNENLNKEIFDLKSNLEEKNNLIVFLNEKITFLENKLELKDKEILDLKNEGERRDEQIKRLFKEIDVLNIELDAKNFNVEEMKKEEKAEIEVDNLRDILSERENKKKLINEKIKEHVNNSKISYRNKADKNKGYEVNYTDNSQYQYPLQINSERGRKNFFQPEELKKSHESKNSRVSKHDLISDLIVKITSTPENIDYLNKKFGKDFMNKIFSPETEEHYLRNLEKALEEKNSTQRTANFAASFGKNNEEQNLFKNTNNLSKRKNNICNSSDDNSTPERDKNIFPNSYQRLKNQSINSKSEISNNPSFNKYKNPQKSNTNKTLNLNSFEEKSSEKILNQSVNNFLPGKNYARNILCKTMGNRFKVSNGNIFEKNLRSYGGKEKTESNRSFTKSSDKKIFNNYSSNHSRTFDEHSKNSKIQNLNKSSSKNSKYKNTANSKQEFNFRDSNSHEISFSNNNNFNNNNNNERENNVMESIATNRSNNHNDERNNSKSNSNYLNNNAINYLNNNQNNNLKKKNSEKNNIVINEEYNYPYSSVNDDKVAKYDYQDNLNQQIDEFMNENFNDKKSNKTGNEEKFGYLGTHHSKKSEKEKNDYNFESDRMSLNKNDDLNVENIDDIDMEAIKNSIYNNLSEREMQ